MVSYFTNFVLATGLTNESEIKKKQKKDSFIVCQSSAMELFRANRGILAQKMMTVIVFCCCCCIAIFIKYLFISLFYNSCCNIFMFCRSTQQLFCCKAWVSSQPKASVESARPPSAKLPRMARSGTGCAMVSVGQRHIFGQGQFLRIQILDLIGLSALPTVFRVKT